MISSLEMCEQLVTVNKRNFKSVFFFRRIVGFFSREVSRTPCIDRSEGRETVMNAFAAAGERDKCA